MECDDRVSVGRDKGVLWVPYVNEPPGNQVVLVAVSDHQPR